MDRLYVGEEQVRVGDFVIIRHGSGAAWWGCGMRTGYVTDLAVDALDGGAVLWLDDNPWTPVYAEDVRWIRVEHPHAAARME